MVHSLLAGLGLDSKNGSLELTLRSRLFLSVINSGDFATIREYRKCEKYTRINLYQTAKLGILDIDGDSGKSVIDPEGGLMDLNFDLLGCRKLDLGNSASYDIALAHNYIQNGDVMADPDMEIRIYPEIMWAEALSYQLDGLGIYQVVYPEPGKVYPKLKKELNVFLNQWLGNCIRQGHTFTDKQEIAA